MRALAWLVATALVAGCGDRPAGAPIGYFVESDRCLAGIDRVVLVDLRPDAGTEAHARNMTETLSKELRAARLFHVETLDRTDPALRDLPLDKRSMLSLDEIRTMRETLGSDAVLFGTVTHFQTHPRMAVGLFLRLLDLRRGTVVWAVDTTWDTTEKQTEGRMKTFFDAQMREGYGPADWRMARMSPLTFQKFIAYEIARTMPPPPGR